MRTEHFRFSPDILRRLGEELIPQVDQGIVELVRNAYDADAVTCSVRLDSTEQPGGTLYIIDDGDGMTADAIRNGWLVLGRSAKVTRRPTKLGRVPVGDKGLGRLAALRMGAVATLCTRPWDEPGVEYLLELDWDRFDAAAIVEEVELDIRSRPTSEEHGTTVEVSRLRVKLGRREVERLARALLLLADPFEGSAGFRPELVAPAFKDLERRVREGYFEDAEFHLVATLDEKGHASAQVSDRTARVRWMANSEDLGKGPRKTNYLYKTSPATFELWAFNLNPQTFALNTPTHELHRWLDTMGGVHLYHRGLRVHPYGDAGYDWLDMNLARARSPEMRPSTNTSVGRIVVPDPRDELVQKTDRSGFIENEAFAELRRFAQDALDWMASERVRERDARRVKERAQSRQAVSEAKASLGKALKQLPPQDRPAVKQAVQLLEAAREQEARTLREDVQLYRTLGTVGTTAAVFAHESAKPVTMIDQMAKVIESRGRQALGHAYADLLDNPVQHIFRSTQALRSFAALPLRLLAREKRRTGRVDVHTVISDVVQLFEPFLKDAQINPKLDLVDASPQVRGTVAAIEAVLANLLTNAANALDSEDLPSEVRDVVIRTELGGADRLIIRVLDSGTGIAGLSVEDIWLPGRTTRPGGTGLGLTIVRDTVADLGGRVQVVPRGELGGAEFIIDLPIVSGGL